jgi:hypothetical protein
MIYVTDSLTSKTKTLIIAAASVCFQNPVAVTTGNLGTYYDADGGGESISYDGQTTTFIHGLLVQQYQPDTIPETPSIVANTAYGEAPLDYPIGTNFGPNGMVVDPYENLFFTDPNNGVAVWCGWGLNTNAPSRATAMAAAAGAHPWSC